MSVVRRVTIFCRQETVSSASTAATVKIYLNQAPSGAWLASKTVIRNDINKGYAEFEINKPYINSIQLEIEYPTEASIASDFNPSHATIEYEPSQDIG